MNYLDMTTSINLVKHEIQTDCRKKGSIARRVTLTPYYEAVVSNYMDSWLRRNGLPTTKINCNWHVRYVGAGIQCEYILNGVCQLVVLVEEISLVDVVIYWCYLGEPIVAGSKEADLLSKEIRNWASRKQDKQSKETIEDYG